MNEQYVTPRKAQEHYKVCGNTLRNWARSGRIKYIRTEAGHRRYLLSNRDSDRECYIYARVSSKKQAGDLKNQIRYLKKIRPSGKVIKDIASGLNFKRKGLETLLEQVLLGRVKEVVVAHKDRLARFGFDLIEWLFRKHNVILTVLSEAHKTEQEELAEDVISIITVFSSKHHGRRSYKVKKDKNLPQTETA